MSRANPAIDDDGTLVDFISEEGVIRKARPIES